MRNAKIPLTVFAAFLWAAISNPSASAQTCTWGGASTLKSPRVVWLRTLPTAFKVPRAVAANNLGRVFVADAGARIVATFDLFGRLLGVQHGFGRPLALATDPQGRLYVADAETGNVTVWDFFGHQLNQLGQGRGEFLLPTGIAIDPWDSRVYVADAGRSVIRVYSPTGAWLFDFGGPGTGPGQFQLPQGILVSTSGNVFVSDQNNDRVQVFTRQGQFVRCFGRRGGMTLSQRFGRLFGVTEDGQGRLYLADSFFDTITVMDPGGVTLGYVGQLGERDGGLRTPTSVALDPVNRLWVVSANTGRVEIFGIDEYSDPHVVAAQVSITPDRIVPGKTTGIIWFYLRLAEGSVKDVDLASLRVNRLALSPTGPPPRFNDEELIFSIDVQRLYPTLVGSGGLIVVDGSFYDGTPFHGVVKVINTFREGRP